MHATNIQTARRISRKTFGDYLLKDSIFSEDEGQSWCLYKGKI